MRAKNVAVTFTTRSLRREKAKPVNDEVKQYTVLDYARASHSLIDKRAGILGAGEWSKLFDAFHFTREPLESRRIAQSRLTIGVTPTIKDGRPRYALT